MNNNGYGLLNSTPFGKYRAMVMEGLEDNPMQGDGFPNQRLIDAIHRDVHKGGYDYAFKPENFAEILNRLGEAYLGPDWHRGGVTEWEIDADVMLEYRDSGDLGDMKGEVGYDPDAMFKVTSLQFQFEGSREKVYIVGRGQKGPMEFGRAGRLPVELVYGDSFACDLMPAWENKLREMTR